MKRYRKVRKVPAKGAKNSYPFANFASSLCVLCGKILILWYTGRKTMLPVREDAREKFGFAPANFCIMDKGINGLFASAHDVPVIPRRGTKRCG
jgi:hypothetical protein